MASVGIVGGLGPESTIDYYRSILAAWSRDTPDTAPSIVIDSLDVKHGIRLVSSDLPGLTEYLLESVHRLTNADVGFAAMAANTPHIVFDELAARSPIPLLGIVDVCADEARRLGLERPGLLATRFTMEADFYQRAFSRRDITIVIPKEDERSWVHARYIGELLEGDFRKETRADFLALIARMRDRDAIDGLILGGTELPLLLRNSVLDGLPTLDSAILHVEAIVRRLRAIESSTSAG